MTTGPIVLGIAPFNKKKLTLTVSKVAFKKEIIRRVTKSTLLH
jgi:hypothetical protein